MLLFTVVARAEILLTQDDVQLMYSIITTYTNNHTSMPPPDSPPHFGALLVPEAEIDRSQDLFCTT